MAQSKEEIRENPLAVKPVGKLLVQFAIPSIIAMMVTSIYNIVDQFFIGRNVGELGNAATNIAFPMSMVCTALALLVGIGGASAFNLTMGKGDKEKAPYFMGNAAVLLAVCGIVLCIFTVIFLDPLMRFFGSPDNVLDYAKTYTGIIAFGFPFLLITNGGGHLLRADGRPRMSMICNLTGAIINIFLDALFVAVLQWGMAGAAIATVTGQIISALIAIWALCHCQTVKLQRKHLLPRGENVKRIITLGSAPFGNSIAMVVVQVALNNTLKHYGALSAYGSAVPIACVGIVTKLNQLYLSIVVGISQGMQPITGFNYGAKNFGRVKNAYLRSIACCFVIGIAATIIYEGFPHQLMALFGAGSDEYFEFGVRYLRIFLCLAFVNFLPTFSSNFFTSIGKPGRGMFLSMSRQIIYFLPLLVILPLFMGIEGVFYVGPIADAIAVVTTAVFVVRELRDKKYTQPCG